MYRSLSVSLISAALLASAVSAEPIGEFTELTGPARVDKKRGGTEEASRGTSVESYDTVRTAGSRATISFVDKTRVSVTENSKLVIDEYVYDSATSSGKMAMRVALGTVRYASGAIAKSDNRSMDIKTPTATIGVRGTEFSSSVDEMGRSLVVLLPNADGRTGAVVVETDAGSVYLDQPYQATYVQSSVADPSPPVVIEVGEARQVDGSVLLSNPVLARAEASLWRTDLDGDALAFSDLTFSELDADLLAVAEVDPLASAEPTTREPVKKTEPVVVLSEANGKTFRARLNRELTYAVSLEQGGGQLPTIYVRDPSSSVEPKSRIVIVQR